MDSEVETENMDVNDDSSSSDEEDKALEIRAEEFERTLSDNKYLYDVHVELVDLYRRLSDLKSMRAAYNRFHEYFPLTPAIWLNWIRDEINMASSQSEKKHVLTLFRKATEDYISVELWLEYVQYAIGICEIEDTRSIIEKGLNLVGLHVSQGSLLWDTYRELELAHLSLNEQHTEEWRNQLLKVVEVFRRQLTVPLLRMDNTYMEWQEWLKQLPEGHGVDTKPVEWGYQKSLKLLEKYKEHEDKLLACKYDQELWETYKEYIKLVSDPAMVICLYERAVAKLSLNTDVWYDYCLCTIKLGEISLVTTKKALRNCPWSEELWVLRMRILENEKRDEKEIMECFEQGLSSVTNSFGLELWLTYLECVRRMSKSQQQLYKLFHQAVQQLGEQGDPTYKIARWEARIHAQNGDMTTARKIWTDILHSPNYKNSANPWLEYAALERQYGDVNQLRVLFKKAIKSCSDWAQYIAEEWLMFERECGSLKDILKCMDIYKECVKTTDVTKMVEGSKANDNKREFRKRSYAFDEDVSNSKRAKITEKFNNVTINIKKPTEVDPERSVFLSNMRADVTEEQLKVLFPNAESISIPVDRKGISRCYAYMEFKTHEEAEEALKRDRECLDERPLFISRCRSDRTQKQQVFKYSPENEAKKLFVRNLPYSATQKDIEDFFKPHGAIAVRLLTHRSGKPKGLAYVEFSDEDAAAKAMKVTDQQKIGEFVISVAISKPPPKKNADFSFSTSGQLEPIRHARSRLQVPLIPRSLQTKTANSQSQGPSKTNDDFRKMLLNK